MTTLRWFTDHPHHHTAQVQHTVDYAVGSTLWLHLSNGLNLQVVHHLFPQVGWGHYTALAPIIAEVCRQHGVAYATKVSERVCE